MPDPTNTPPAGTQQQPDVSGQIASLASAMQQLAESQKSIVETLGKLGQPQQQAAANKGDAAKPLTAEDFGRMMDERLKSFATTQQTATARQQFIGDKLKDLPRVYQDRLGNDPAKFAQEEQAIRQEYQTDFKVAGGTTPNVGGDNPGGAKPAQTVDLSKLNPVQKIAQGLRERPIPGQSQPPVNAPVAGATGTAAAPAK